MIPDDRLAHHERLPAVSSAGNGAKKAFLCIFVLLCGCALWRIQPNPSTPVYTIAVLPFYNATNSVEGPEKVRKEVWKSFRKRHYDLMPLEEVDSILMDRMGITLGHQLELVSPEEVGRTLGVDGLVYGYLLNFDDIITGVYNERRVRAGFKLIEARSGRTIWARGLGVKTLYKGGKVGSVFTSLVGDEAGSGIPGTEHIPGLNEWRLYREDKSESMAEAAFGALFESILEKMLGIYMWSEYDYLVDEVIKDLPAGPGSPRSIPSGSMILQHSKEADLR